MRGNLYETVVGLAKYQLGVARLSQSGNILFLILQDARDMVTLYSMCFSKPIPLFVHNRYYLMSKAVQNIIFETCVESSLYISFLKVSMISHTK